MDIAECGVVEIAAVRVRGQVIVEQFERLVRPNRPVSVKASEVHGYYDRGPLRPADLRGDLARVSRVRRRRPPGGTQRAEVRRAGAAAVSPPGLPELEDLIFFDTLPLARSLMEESAKLEDLAHRFGVSIGPLAPRAGRRRARWPACCVIWVSSRWRTPASRRW